VISIVTKSADDTKAVAASVAALAGPGEVILLSGDLGAGKTTFAQGFGQALGISEPIVSPTFTLVRTYPGRLNLVHCDAYRLDGVAEVEDLGLSELLEDGGVAVVEWGEVVAAALPADFLEVRMEAGSGDDDDDRILAFRAVGPTWSARWLQLELALGRWSA